MLGRRLGDSVSFASVGKATVQRLFRAIPAFVIFAGGACGLVVVTTILTDVAEFSNPQYLAAAALPLPARRAKAVLRLLLDGNRRFVSGAPLYQRNISSARAAAAEQRPVAAVFTCVDSRVTAESLFDCDFGQLIVVRTAGHVLDDASAGSLEFAATQLAVPLVVVLGHERCGAISLAVNTLRAEPEAHDVGFLVDQLREPVGKALTEQGEDTYRSAMLLQIEQTVSALRSREGLAQARIVGACYDLDEGTVQLVE